MNPGCTAVVVTLTDSVTKYYAYAIHDMDVSLDI